MHDERMNWVVCIISKTKTNINEFQLLDYRKYIWIGVQMPSIPFDAFILLLIFPKRHHCKLYIRFNQF